MNRPLSIVQLSLLATFFPLTAHAADSPVGKPLCELLRTINPEVKTYEPAGARAQLVMAITEKFDADTDALTKAWNEIDSATTSECPKDREELLKVVKTETLKEALQ